MSLIILDIDFFKRFNDLYGHLTGDQALRLVASMMRDKFREQARDHPLRRRGIRDHPAGGRPYRARQGAETVRQRHRARVDEALDHE